MTDCPKLAPAVERAYKAREDKMARKQKEVEAEYLKMAKTDKPTANRMPNDFSLRIMVDAEGLTGDLANQLFTTRTKDTRSDIFFANVTKKD